MPRQHQLQLGLREIFRLFVGIRLILVALVVVRRYSLLGESIQDVTLLSLLVGGYLLLHLSFDSIQHLFGRFYLPFAIVIITLSILIEQHEWRLRLAMGEITTVANVFSENAIALQSPAVLALGTTFLFVPLVIVSWQYSFQASIVYSIAITLFDLSSLPSLRQYLETSGLDEFISIGFRALSFIIVGYIVAKVVRLQREQTTAAETANEQLKHYAATQEQLGISRERNRMARELHDTLAHTLGAMTIKLNAANMIWESDSPKAKEMLEEVIANMDDGLNATRRALRDLRASPLEDMGLLLALEQTAKGAAQRAGTQLILHLPNTFPPLTTIIEQGIYRIAQEALENSVKHANADMIDLRLVLTKQRCMLTIKDNGQGFSLDSVFEDNFGLQGMRERAEMLGADIDIQSAVGQGTRIHVGLEIDQ